MHSIRTTSCMEVRMFSRVGQKRLFFSNLTWVEIKRRVFMRKWAWENFSSLRQKFSDPHDLWKANFFLRNITNVHNIPIFCVTRYWIGVVSISITHALNSICESFTLICYIFTDPQDIVILTKSRKYWKIHNCEFSPSG